MVELMMGSAMAARVAIVALYSLVNKTGGPYKTSLRVEKAQVFDLLDRTLDAGTGLLAAFAARETNEEVDSVTKTINVKVDGTEDGTVASKDDDFCDPGERVAVRDDQLAAALHVAWLRTTAAETQGMVEGLERQPNVSPFWKTMDKSEWESALFKDVGLSAEMAQPSVFRLLQRKLATKTLFGSRQTSPGEPDSTKYARYVVLRGICALNGPHESKAAGDPLEYNFVRSAPPAVSMVDKLVQRKAPPMQPALRDLLRIESVRGCGATLNEFDDIDKGGVDMAHALLKDADGDADGGEPARQVRWAPVAVNGEILLDGDLAPAMSKAATLEVLIKHLKEQKGDPDKRSPSLAATIGSTKLRQLHALAAVSRGAHSGAATVSAAMRALANDTDTASVFVTRPAYACVVKGEDGRPPRQTMLYPVAPGLAHFKRPLSNPNSNPVAVDTALPLTNKSIYGKNYENSDLEATNHDLTTWLQSSSSVEGAFSNVYVGPSATKQPYTSTNAREGRFIAGQDLPEEHLSLTSIRRMMRHGFANLDALERLEHEEAVANDLEQPDSERRARYFGLHPDPETRSRDRRGALWEDCMRQIAVSTDRFLIFARKVSGALGEDVSEVLASGDAEMEAAQRDLSKYRTQLVERTLSFQTDLVKNVMDAAVRSSKLQLSLEGQATTMGESFASSLVVVNQEMRETAERLSSGKDGTPFFQTAVELRTLLDRPKETLTLADLMTGLLDIGSGFHQRLATDLHAGNAPGSRLSLDTLTKPHNLYVVRFKADFYAALNTALASFRSAMRQAHGPDAYMMGHRDISLWELVETDNLDLSQAFAQYCAISLQWLRNNNTNRSIYVSEFASNTNGTVAKHVRQHLVTVACRYLYLHPERPAFLQRGGRERYYGGGIDEVPPVAPCATTDDVPPPPPKRARVAHDEDDDEDEDDTLLRFATMTEPAVRERLARVLGKIVPGDVPAGPGGIALAVTQLADAKTQTQTPSANREEPNGSQTPTLPNVGDTKSRAIMKFAGMFNRVWKIGPKMAEAAAKLVLYNLYGQAADARRDQIDFLRYCLKPESQNQGPFEVLSDLFNSSPAKNDQPKDSKNDQPDKFTAVQELANEDSVVVEVDRQLRGRLVPSNAPNGTLLVQLPLPPVKNKYYCVELDMSTFKFDVEIGEIHRALNIAFHLQHLTANMWSKSEQNGTSPLTTWTRPQRVNNDKAYRAHILALGDVLPATWVVVWYLATNRGGLKNAKDAHLSAARFVKLILLLFVLMATVFTAKTTGMWDTFIGLLGMGPTPVELTGMDRYTDTLTSMFSGSACSTTNQSVEDAVVKPKPAREAGLRPAETGQGQGQGQGWGFASPKPGEASPKPTPRSPSPF
jgi:hypothetical protein